MATVNFKHGTYVNFKSLTHDANTLYFVEDLGKIYKGDADVTSAFVIVSHAAYGELTTANTVPGQFYLDAQTGGIKIHKKYTESGQTTDAIVELFEALPLLITGIKSGEKVLSLSGTDIQTTLTLAYDSTNKKIQLKGVGGAVVTDLDATVFIKDGMVDTAYLEDGTGPDAGKVFLVIVFNTDAGKETIRLDVSELIDVYTAGSGLALNGHEFSIDNTVTAGSVLPASTSLAFGQATTVVVASYDTNGLITGTQNVSITLPALPAAVTGTIGNSNNTKVVTYANLTDSTFSGNTLDIGDAAPQTMPDIEVIASTKAVYDAMSKWETFNS